MRDLRRMPLGNRSRLANIALSPRNGHVDIRVGFRGRWTPATLPVPLAAVVANEAVRVPLVVDEVRETTPELLRIHVGGSLAMPAPWNLMLQVKFTVPVKPFWEFTVMTEVLPLFAPGAPMVKDGAETVNVGGKAVTTTKTANEYAP